MYGKSVVMAFAALALAAAVAGAQECDPEASATRPKEEQDALRNWFAVEPKMEELRIVFRAPRALVRQRLTNAMLACHIPVARSSDDVIEADYGEQSGAWGNYTIVTRAYVVAMDDSTTLVRLAGRETSKRGDALHPEVKTVPITNKNGGRSKEAWIALRNVAKQLRADTTLHADLSRSTALNLYFTP